MRLDCDTVEGLLLDDLDDALDNVKRERLMRHLADCPDCRALQEKMRHAQDAAAILRRQRESVIMPAHVPALIKQQLTPKRSFFGFPLWRVASTMAMVILMIAVVLVYQNVILGKSQTQTGTATPSAAFGDNRGDDTGTRESAKEPADVIKPATKAAQPVTSAATTAAGNRTAGIDMAISQSAPPFVLYNGSLADLKPIWSVSDKNQTESTAESTLQIAVSESLSDARVLRILTNPGEPVRKVIILAGYDATQARQEINTLQSLYRVANPTVSITLVEPDDQPRLTALFGQSLYSQLLPSINERQLTYLLIEIGG